MSLYSKNAKIDGLEFGLVMRGMANGQYVVVFEQESATLEQIEAVNWARPDIEGDCILPAGYGFEVESITYASADHSYRVTLRVGRQYLGDVTEYMDKVEELTARMDEQNVQMEELRQQTDVAREQIAALRDQLAEADEALISMYEAGLEAAGPEETEPEEDIGEEDAQ